MELIENSLLENRGCETSTYYLRVVDNHVVVLDSSALVLFCDPTEGVEEETVTKLHDVGLVDASNFLQKCVQ